MEEKTKCTRKFNKENAIAIFAGSILAIMFIVGIAFCSILPAIILIAIAGLVSFDLVFPCYKDKTEVKKE